MMASRRKQVDRLLARRRVARERLAEAEAGLEAARRKRKAARLARAAAQAVAAGVQAEAHSRVADLVTRCLAAVFGEDAYEFRLVFEAKRGKTEARPAFVRDGAERSPREVGGGVIDVAAFALRLSVLMLSRPPLRRLLVLDEPFRFVSAEYRPRVRALLEALAAETGVQIVLVTHSPEFEVGTVVRIG